VRPIDAPPPASRRSLTQRNCRIHRRDLSSVEASPLGSRAFHGAQAALNGCDVTLLRAKCPHDAELFSVGRRFGRSIDNVKAFMREGTGERNGILHRVLVRLGLVSDKDGRAIRPRGRDGPCGNLARGMNDDGWRSRCRVAKKFQRTGDSRI
jgi:hypothetical protein